MARTLSRRATLGAARGASLLLSLAACAPDRVARYLPGEGAVGVLVALVDADGHTRELRGYARAELPDPLVLDPAEGDRVIVAELDRPLAVDFALGAGHELELRPAGAPLDEAWELLPPIAATELRAGEAPIALEPAAIEAWRAGFTLARPPCPTVRTRPISALPGGAVGLVLRFGDDLLIGQLNDLDGPARVYFMRAGSDRLEPIDALEEQASVSLRPVGFVDGERASFLLRVPPRLVTIDRTGAVTASVALEVEELREGTLFTEAAVGRFGAERSVVFRARDPEGPGSRERTRLYRLDEPNRRLVTLALGPDEGGASCGRAYETLVLELERPGAGLAGMLASPVRRFDAAVPGGLPPGRAPFGEEPLCANSRATLADGVELFTDQGGGEVPTGLLWREPGGAWAHVANVGALTGQLVRAFGDLAFVAADQHVVSVYQHAPSRPSVPPRRCADLTVNLNPLAGRRATPPASSSEGARPPASRSSTSIPEPSPGYRAVTGPPGSRRSRFGAGHAWDRGAMTAPLYRPPQRTTTARLFTDAGWIEGTFHLPLKARLLEHLEHAPEFLSLTDVSLASSGAAIPFFAARTEAIAFAIPARDETMRCLDRLDLRQFHETPVDLLLPTGQLSGVLDVPEGSRISHQLAHGPRVLTLKKARLRLRDPWTGVAFEEEAEVALVFRSQVVGATESGA